MRHLASLLGALLLLPAATHAETFKEVKGVVSMEAEHFTSNDGYTVRKDRGPKNVAAGWSGDGWVFTDSGADDPQSLDYQITFTNTGTYCVQLRALAGYTADWISDWEGLDNGFHADFDGVNVTSRKGGDGIFVLKNRKWLWYGAHQHVSPPKPVCFAVDKPGVHTFTIVRREYLGRLDKIVLHKKGMYGIYRKGTEPRSDITGTGPAETVDRGSTADAGPAAVDASTPDAGPAAVDASTPDAGPAAVDASLGNDASSGARLRIEAEDMSLETYRVEKGAGYASNSRLITLRDGDTGETGTASYSFTGDAGLYDVVLAYFDENDGTASLQLHIDGDQLADFSLDQDLGGAAASTKTLVRKTVVSAYALTRGSSIRITGVEDPNEPARVDYIELVPASAALDAGPTDAARRDSPNLDATQNDAGVRDAAEPRDDVATGGCATTQPHGQPSVLLLGAMLCLAWLRRRGARPWGTRPAEASRPDEADEQP